MRVGAYVHVHVSEREPDRQPEDPDDPPGWEDCVWASGVELARTVGIAAPATLAEAEALRRASGEPPGGGSSAGDLVAGMRRRYGWAPPERGNTAALALPVGGVAVVLGSSRALSAHYRRWDPSFAGGHAATVWRLGPEPRVWWCDPLAPAGWDGEWMPLDELGRYVRAMTAAGALIATVDERRAPMIGTVELHPFPELVTWRTRPGSTLHGYDPTRPGAPVLTRTWDNASAAHADATAAVTWTGTSSPPVPKGGPFLRVTDGTYAGLLIVAAQVDWTAPADPVEAWRAWYELAPA